MLGVNLETHYRLDGESAHDFRHRVSAHERIDIPAAFDRRKLQVPWWDDEAREMIFATPADGYEGTIVTRYWQEPYRDFKARAGADGSFVCEKRHNRVVFFAKMRKVEGEPREDEHGQFFTGPAGPQPDYVDDLGRAFEVKVGGRPYCVDTGQLDAYRKMREPRERVTEKRVGELTSVTIEDDNSPEALTRRIIDGVFEAHPFVQSVALILTALLVALGMLTS